MGARKDIYDIHIVSAVGELTVALGTPQAKGWMNKYKNIIANARYAELIPRHHAKEFPSVRVEYDGEKQFIYYITTSGVIIGGDKNRLHKEFAVYHLGWKDSDRVEVLSVYPDGSVHLETGKIYGGGK